MLICHCSSRYGYHFPVYPIKEKIKLQRSSVLCSWHPPVSCISPTGGIYLWAFGLLTKSIQYIPLEIIFSMLKPFMMHFMYCPSCFTARARRDIYVWRLGKILTMVTQVLILLAGPFSLCFVLWLKIVGNAFINRYEIVLLLLIQAHYLVAVIYSVLKDKKELLVIREIVLCVLWMRTINCYN